MLTTILNTISISYTNTIITSYTISTSYTERFITIKHIRVQPHHISQLTYKKNIFIN